MPVRKTVFTTGNYYHIYNRGVNKSQVFFGVADFKRFYNLLNYYRNDSPPLRYSDYADLNAQVMLEFISKLAECQKIAEVHAYCFMDNHYHLLLKQTQDGVNFLTFDVRSCSHIQFDIVSNINANTTKY